MQEEPINIALEIVNQVEEQLPQRYQVEAFRVLLEHRLGIKAVAIAGKVAREFPVAEEEMSFSEFLNQLGELQTNPQRFAAVASYYERYRRESSVNQDDIVNTMTDAGLRAPGNFSRDMRGATSARNALLMQARQRKDGSPAWQLTRTGRTFIEQRISAT